MKKTLMKVGLVLTICASLGLSSCIGSFALSNRVLSWNNSIGNKIVNELVFIAFWVLPVYEVTTIADILVLNTIEFWSGSNPMAQSTTRIEGNDGNRYLVECDGKGYNITNESDNSMVRLDFDANDNSWDIVLDNGERYELLTFVDDNHVSLPNADGTRCTVSLDEAGLMAYRNSAASPLFAAR